MGAHMSGMVDQMLCFIMDFFQFFGLTASKMSQATTMVNRVMPLEKFSSTLSILYLAKLKEHEQIWKETAESVKSVRQHFGYDEVINFPCTFGLNNEIDITSLYPDDCDYTYYGLMHPHNN